MDKRKQVTFVVAFGISFIVFLCFLFFQYNNRSFIGDQYTEARGLDNLIVVYVLGILLFLLVFLFLYNLFYWFLCRYEGNLVLKSEIDMTIEAGIFLLGCIAFLQWRIIGQYNERGMNAEIFNDIPVSVRWFVFAVVFLYIIFLVYKNFDVLSSTVWLVFILSLLVPFLQFYVNPYVVNVSGDYFMSICNYTSVAETIYNVYDRVPFDATTTGLYGHYSLFFFLLKFFGKCTPRKIMIMFALSAVICQICSNYIICRFAPRNWIAILLILASISRSIYCTPAIFPIRTMFPMIFCLLILLFKDKELNGFYFYIPLNICIVFAILWNLESGLACAFGMMAYVLMKKMNRYGRLNKYIVFSLFINCIYIIIDIFLAVLIVGIYNLYVGGQFGFREFFYPYTNAKLVYSFVSYIPPIGNYAWVYIVFILLACLAWNFIKIDGKGGKGDEILFSYATICITLFSYYMNEARFGCREIVRNLFVCIIALIISRMYRYVVVSPMKPNLLHRINRSIVFLLVFVCLDLSIYSITDSVRIESRQSLGAYSFEGFNDDTDDLMEILSDGCFGVGQGANGIYHKLGLDNHMKMIDTSAWTLDENVMNAGVNEILKHDKFFISGDRYDEFIIDEINCRDGNYKLTAEYTVDGLDYYIYQR